MKKITVIIIFVYLLAMFLIYSGLFRDNANPLDVVKYYFDCLRNHEGFLTYSISTPDFFNEDKDWTLYKKYRMDDIAAVELELIKTENNYACVRTQIIYRDKNAIYADVELEKNDKIWLMRNVTYENIQNL